VPAWVVLPEPKLESWLTPPDRKPRSTEIPYGMIDVGVHHNRALTGSSAWVVDFV
jgi:hypothetical protein